MGIPPFAPEGWLPPQAFARELDNGQRRGVGVGLDGEVHEQVAVLAEAHGIIAEVVHDLGRGVDECTPVSNGQVVVDTRLSLGTLARPTTTGRMGVRRALCTDHAAVDARQHICTGAATVLVVNGGHRRRLPSKWRRRRQRRRRRCRRSRASRKAGRFPGREAEVSAASPSAGRTAVVPVGVQYEARQP